jgi:hypothetical protein
MHIKDIATALLERLKTSTIVDGKTKEKIGSDGLSYSLKQHWVELDEASECLQINQKLDKIAEIRQCSKVEPQPIAEAAKKSLRDFLPAQSKITEDRQNFQRDTQPCKSLNEGTLFLILKSNQPAAVTEDDEAKVGESVDVVEDGQVYQGVVQSVKPDGSLVLSFSGPKKPTKAKPAYQKNEVARSANKTTTPTATPAPQQPVQNTGPRAPGLGY